MASPRGRRGLLPRIDMELSLEETKHPAWVGECSPEGIRFASGLFKRALIIHYQSSQVDTPASLPASCAGLGIEHLGFIEQQDFEILVVGTGAESLWLPAPVSAYIQGRGIGIETAATRQACYILNVLLSEQRRVAAILFPMAGSAPADADKG